MALSTLDLFILTFNCGKNLINVAAYASHLHAALVQNATELPDLVVLNLQEAAPLSYSFIGSYFLSPYYARFDEALNLAAERVAASSTAEAEETSPFVPHAAANDGSSTAGSSSTAISTNGGEAVDERRRLGQWRPSRRNTGRADRRYTLIRAKNVGMTAILLFARNPASVESVLEAETSFGAADIGNKGAVGLRVLWKAPARGGDGGEGSAASDGRVTELTFVSAHLAAMEWNLKRRNANWKSVVSGLTFADPKAVVAGLAKGADTPLIAEPTPSVEEPVDDSDTQPLLPASYPRTDSGIAGDGAPSLTPEQTAALHNASIYKPGAHLFVAGDLNYRIATTTPPALALFPSFDKTAENYWSEFLPRDQLQQEKTAGRTLHGLVEHDVRFGPTYKYVVLPPGELEGAVNEDAVRAGLRVGLAGDEVDVVPWRWAGHRWPSWCDRVLYWPVPEWVAGSPKDETSEIAVKAYSSLPVVRTSDHRAVFLRVSVPVLAPDELGAAPPAELQASGQLDSDPRVKLPAPIDLEAWQKRAEARRKEAVVGWTMYLWSTREGAMFIATFVMVGVASWWAYRVFW